MKMRFDQAEREFVERVQTRLFIELRIGARPIGGERPARRRPVHVSTFRKWG